jgi:hypothetical protein
MHILNLPVATHGHDPSNIKERKQSLTLFCQIRILVHRASVPRGFDRFEFPKQADRYGLELDAVIQVELPT